MALLNIEPLMSGLCYTMEQKPLSDLTWLVKLFMKESRVKETAQSCYDCRH
jgi:hypothetical protein